MLDKKNPEDQMDLIKQSMKFIYEFCQDKNIKLRDYPFYKSVVQNDCLLHLKQHKLSWYIVPFIPELQRLISDMPRDEFELYFGDDKTLAEYIVKIAKDNRTKTFIQKALKLVEKDLKRLEI